jgi:hypothetical protein
LGFAGAPRAIREALENADDQPTRRARTLSTAAGGCSTHPKKRSSSMRGGALSAVGCAGRNARGDDVIYFNREAIMSPHLFQKLAVPGICVAC